MRTQDVRGGLEGCRGTLVNSWGVLGRFWGACKVLGFAVPRELWHLPSISHAIPVQCSNSSLGTAGSQGVFGGPGGSLERSGAFVFGSGLFSKSGLRGVSMSLVLSLAILYIFARWITPHWKQWASILQMLSACPVRRIC